MVFDFFVKFQTTNGNLHLEEVIKRLVEIKNSGTILIDEL